MNNTNFVSIFLNGRGFSSAPWMNKHNKSVNTKEEQKGRTLLPICEADVLLFLSDVYNKKYTSEKMTSRCPQSGRSMIEMLGVLAIIGVLSVGGIAGYSKAMQKYRVNKTIEQITLIAGNVRSFFRGKYTDLNSSNKNTIIRKAKLVPEEMWNYTGFTSVFGNNVEIGYGCSGSNGKGFQIAYILNDVDACIEIITHDWKSIGVDKIINQMDGYTLDTNVSIERIVNIVDQMCNNYTTNFCFDTQKGY